MAEISDEACRELQQILEKQHRQTSAIEEVKEVGNGLVDFLRYFLNYLKKLNRHKSKR